MTRSDEEGEVSRLRRWSGQRVEVELVLEEAAA
jgi:hypothetical protein